MLKNILQLDGAEGLSRKEQLNVSGAGRIYSLCAEPAQWCNADRSYDPCAPISKYNYPCGD
ncbi:hypothetical protein [Flavobacterium sp. GCM10027622]|uniref:hypothetical protein n=1 Tax=unclassified Flavobacterium TaxID=196869 RepID=UPI00361795CD